MNTTTPEQPQPGLRPVPHARVQLADTSIFAPARDRMLHLARVYPADRLLAVFRANASLDTRGAEPPGGWEGWGHVNEQPWGEHDYPGQEQAQTGNLLRGHYAGHFLSMLALAYAGTEETELKNTVDEVVTGLAEVQEALAATGRFSHPGFLAAYGEWQFSRLEDYAPYGEIWAPYYTTHKIMAGLLDAYELAHNSQALEVVTAMAHWVHGRLEKLPTQQIQTMWSLYIAGEFGGMNETLARLAQVTGEQKFLATAQFFDQVNLLTMCAQGEDILDDMHANQHIPQFIGYIHEYELTGEQRYLDAATGLFDMVVPGRTYAHGGSGESELWGPANTQAGDIGKRNAETCVAYNMLKLARGLFGHTGDPKYMDYYEQALSNQILGSRKNADSDVSPEVTYMFGVNPGARREFNNIGTCCGGTGLENHVKYQDTVFFTGPETTWVNLYSPAVLAAEDSGLGLRISGDYPYTTSVEIHVEQAPAAEHTLMLRIPGWLRHQGQARVAVNGEEVAAAPEPGTYLPVTRVWQANDVVTLNVPMRLCAVPTVDDPHTQHLQIGPTVLMARSEQTLSLKLPLVGARVLDASLKLPAAQDASTAEVLHQLRSQGTMTFAGLAWEPVHSGETTSYHMYVTADDARISFAGEDSSVPNRLRHNGETVLDSIWAGADSPVAGFTSREAFLGRVGQVVEAGHREGVLSAAEAEQVLITAGEADIDGCGAGYTAKIVAGGTSPLGGGEGASSVDRLSVAIEANTVTWSLPACWGQITAPPIVTLAVEGALSATGWYTTHPEITVTAEQLTGAAGAADTASPESAKQLTVEYQINDDAWAPYTHPFSVTAEGHHTVRARITDAAGSTNLAERRLRIDTEPPVTTPQVLIMGAGAEIRLRAQDSVSGLERVQWEGPGTFWATVHGPVMRALGDTEQIIEFAATDVAGNEEPRQQIILPARET